MQCIEKISSPGKAQSSDIFVCARVAVCSDLTWDDVSLWRYVQRRINTDPHLTASLCLAHSESPLTYSQQNAKNKQNWWR